MRVLCVHHKGGVGKTTTAVHVAGVLLATGEPVLLVDGDTQADSYRFFNRGLPPESLTPRTLTFGTNTLTVAPVPLSDGVSTLGPLLRDSGHVVVDAQPNLEQIGSFLGEVRPDLVLLCVKKDDVLSFVHLGSMFAALRALHDAAGLDPVVKVVSTGADPDAFRPYIPPDAVDHSIPPPLPFEPELMGRALLTRQFVWDLPGGAPFGTRYRHLVHDRP